MAQTADVEIGSVFWDEELGLFVVWSVDASGNCADIYQVETGDLGRLTLGDFRHDIRSGTIEPRGKFRDVVRCPLCRGRMRLVADATNARGELAPIVACD